MPLQTFYSSVNYKAAKFLIDTFSYFLTFTHLVMCNIDNKATQNQSFFFPIFNHSLPFLHYIVRMIMQNTIFIYIRIDITFS